ncbi:MAG: glycerate kinase [Limnobacter sp.]|nr:glycerate kinase [Limnobacter sp.]
MQEAGEQFEKLLRDLFQVGVKVAQPDLKFQQYWETVGKPWLDRVAPLRKNVWVFGAGKATAAMAAALESVIADSESLKGFVVTRRGYGVNTRRIRVVEAAHPVPDEDGQRAAKKMLGDLSQVPPGDAVIALISGGGSSLLSVPVRGVPFVDLQQLNRALLSSGAPIDEMNVVRKHLTQTLGGQMAMFCSAPVCQVLISDVPGDDPSLIASGPFSPDDSTFEQATAVIKRWAIQVPHTVQRYLDRGCRGEVPETPGSNSKVFSKVTTHMLASCAMSLQAVSERLEQEGYKVLNLGDSVEGEARDVARVLSAIVHQAAQGKGGWPAPPLALLSGGECTVSMSEATMRQARGGRNSEFLLALSFYLRDLSCDVPLAAMAADTDGTDGVGGHAGALLLPGDLDRAIEEGLAPQRHLDQHTSYDYFDALGRLLVTGPTATNVNDLRVILIGQPQAPEQTET